MAPPETWGPPIWTLFHTLIEKLNPKAYTAVIGSLFNIIVRICKFLPCPECSKDATNFLAKIKVSDYKTKTEFKNMFYLFHNWVNAKKRKPMFNYGNINQYANRDLNLVINNFISKYNTKGNMNLLTDSFNRGFVIRDFLAWFKGNYRAFVEPPLTAPLLEPKVKNESVVVESVVVESGLESVVVESGLESAVVESGLESAVVESVLESVVVKSVVVESGLESAVVESVLESVVKVEEESVLESVVKVEDESVLESVVKVEDDVVIESVLESVVKVEDESGLEERPDFLDKEPIAQKSKKAKGKGKK
jgi:hypothetical protein